MAFLDETGLRRFWEKVKNYIDNKVGAISDELHTKVTATLSSSDWASYSGGGYAQEVTVSGVTATNDVLVAPASAHVETYEKMWCSAIAQAENKLTFRCAIRPSEDVTVEIIILG